MLDFYWITFQIFITYCSATFKGAHRGVTLIPFIRCGRTPEAFVIFTDTRRIRFRSWRKDYILQALSAAYHLWMGRHRCPHPQWDKSGEAEGHRNTPGWLRSKHWIDFWKFPGWWKPLSRVHPPLPISRLKYHCIHPRLRPLSPKQSGWNEIVASAYLQPFPVILN